MHNRISERDHLKRKLTAGVSVHMPAPRRIGKSWTINRLAMDLRAAGWCAVEVDVEGMRTPIAFARDLCQRIEGQHSIKERFQTHARQRIGNLLSGTWGGTPLEALGKVDPIEFAETLIASLHDSGEKSAIIIDEIAYFFLHFAEDDPQGARDFAYKLRGFQQRYRNVRWLLTGSIGLNVIARRFDLEGAFVDFETFEMRPFTAAEARSFLRDPNLQQEFNHAFDAADADFDAMFVELGWLAPYYLKMIANEVRPSVACGPSAPARATAADFRTALDTLLQPNRRSEFAVWGEHVRKNLPTADRAIAERLLNRLSDTPDGEILDTLLAHASQTHAGVTGRQVKDILAMLSNDGLITLTDGRYSFRSGLIRRYWREYEVE
ncbi:hypothetical protein [Azospirillum sp.]|uniref:hypothetical protein n=1 Tax=Azospirillum sp. TaxID=34012 RepID=UPI002611BC6C|nr:hypothetical protein [Azospirillum sp.]